MDNYFDKILVNHISIFNELTNFKKKVNIISDLIFDSFENSGKLLICGNGGSAADAQHIAAEFIGRFEIERGPLPAIALTTDTSVLTCLSNDYNYDQIFSRQIKTLGKENDCLLCISTSGNSQNLINAVKIANEIGLNSIGILGNNGGKLAKLCNYNLIVKSKNTARIQEAHIFLLHAICGIIDCKKAQQNLK